MNDGDVNHIMHATTAVLLAAEHLMTVHGCSARFVSALFDSGVVGVAKTTLAAKFGSKARGATTATTNAATTTSKRSTAHHGQHSQAIANRRCMGICIGTSGHSTTH